MHVWCPSHTETSCSLSLTVFCPSATEAVSAGPVGVVDWEWFRESPRSLGSVQVRLVSVVEVVGPHGPSPVEVLG